MSAHANPPEAGRLAPSTSQHLTLMLGRETFAIGILAIKEIIEYVSVTPVPMMPTSVRGVINLRGAVVPVIDLAARIGRPESSIGKRTCIIIVEFTNGDEQHQVGVLVDGVNAVLEIDEADIEPPPAFGAGVSTEFIQGMARRDSGFVVILDIVRIARATAFPTADASTLAGGAAA